MPTSRLSILSSAPRSARWRARRPAILSALLALACGGGDPAGPGPAPAPLAVTLPGEPAVAAGRLGTGWWAVSERNRQWTGTWPSRPQRTLHLGTAAGAVALPGAAGLSLLDAVAHPSGDVTVLYASDSALSLARLSPSGAERARTLLTGTVQADEPFIGPDDEPRDTARAVPLQLRDAARLAALGEDVVVAFRNGRNTVVAMRWAHGADHRFTPAWRTVVEPGTAIGARSLLGGTFDAWGQLENHWRVLVDAGSDGTIYVAATSRAPFVLLGEAHVAHFGDGAPHPYAFLVTRLDAAGRRLGTTMVPRDGPLELHGLRAWAGGVVATGRTRVLRDGMVDWDGVAAWVGADGTLSADRTVHVQEGDILMDAVRDAGGRWLLAGATGYSQNPNGTSVGDVAAPLLLAAPAPDGALDRVTLPDGPRQTYVRRLLQFAGGLVTVGVRNGPGTHSADGDLSLLLADGFLRTLADD